MPVVRVDVEYLQGVEDPEALTILKNLNVLGYKNVKSVRTVKSYEFSMDGTETDSLRAADEIASKILTNPVIQKYTIRVQK